MATGTCNECRFHLPHYSRPSNRCLKSEDYNAVNMLQNGLAGYCTEFGTRIPLKFATELNPGAHVKWDAMTNLEQIEYTKKMDKP
jgi:hypothetical protein